MQPIHNEDHVLLLNGDVFNAAPSAGEADISWLSSEIDNRQTEEDLLNLFKVIKGPYSCVIYKKSSRTLYFARDSLGRNSLIMGHYEGIFYVTSVNGYGLRNDAVEVPPLGVYACDLDNRSISLHRWTDDILEIDYYRERIEEIEKYFHNRDVKFSLSDITINPKWLQSNPKADPSFRFDDLLKDMLQSDSLDVFTHLLENTEVANAVHTFVRLLSTSVRDRISHTPGLCTNCPRSLLPSCEHAKIGILFSGGVDCTLLAVLADRLIDPQLPINVYNVAFEKPSNKAEQPNWNVPDRVSALEALEELRAINPDREWNLSEVNVHRKTVDHELVNTVSHLVYPLTSVLDESLGGALWFASGGGTDSKSSPEHCCRVLLIGSGADELLGGYTRHRTAFRRTGSVEEELIHDWHRLPSRNLARDDRVIADNGVTPRAPFVEEEFVAFVRSLHPMQRCFHGLAEGLGDKLLLRLAAFQVGLQATATRRKRALQFGSRIADSRQNAKDKSKLLE